MVRRRCEETENPLWGGRGCERGVLVWHTQLLSEPCAQQCRQLHTSRVCYVEVDSGLFRIWHCCRSCFEGWRPQAHRLPAPAAALQ